VRRAAALAVIAIGLLALVASAAASPARQTTVHDIEDEVMCPICGTLLELADSPQAKREKVYVAKLVAGGKTKAEIKDALVTQYGPSVLALPKASGFDLSAYLVPIIAIVIAAIVLAFSVARWRRDGRGSPEQEKDAATAPRSEDAERLDADLSRYDL
jgi:cytochrome c-type biogenesis protein CcmH/NrfF